MKIKITILTLAVVSLFFSVNASIGNIAIKTAKPVTVDKNVSKLAAITKNLEYDFDKPAIRSNYYRNLDQLANTIINDNYAVSLRGHADSIGRYKYNWMLSEYRAVSVKKYLVSKGVKPERIVTTPFGSTVPIASNKTSAGRQKNRRVEIDLKKIS